MSKPRTQIPLVIPVIGCALLVGAISYNFGRERGRDEGRELVKRAANAEISRVSNYLSTRIISAENISSLDTNKATAYRDALGAVDSITLK